MRKWLLSITLFVVPLITNANPVEINKIWYNLNPDDKTAEVTNSIPHNSKTYIGGMVVIPESVMYDGEAYKVTSIGTNMLYDNSDYGVAITLPNSITIINEMGFYKGWLYSINIPTSIKIIGDGAFDRVDKLIIYDWAAWCNISFGGILSNPMHSAESIYMNDDKITDVDIPEGVTSIPNYAFEGNVITSISIPKSVTSIGRSSFYDCNKLTDIYCYADNVPKTDLEAFWFHEPSCWEKVTIHVPANSINEYKKTAPWNKFKEIVALPYSTSDNANSDYSSLIKGKWELTYPGKKRSFVHTHVEFKDDGTFSYTSSKEAYYEEHGKYRVDGDILYEHYSDEEDWSRSKILLLNKMTLSLQELEGEKLSGEPYGYIRMNPNPPTTINPLLIGKWKIKERHGYSHTHVEFKSDGTFSYTSTDSQSYEEHGIFCVDGNILYQMFSDERDWGLSQILKLDETTLVVIDLKGDGVTTSGKEYEYIKESNFTDIRDRYMINKTVGIFTLKGDKLQNPSKGINIIKNSDGTIKKVLIK